MANEVENLTKEIEQLEHLLLEKKERLKTLRSDLFKKDDYGKSTSKEILEPLDVMRYSRHILCPNIGVRGQLALKHGRILIIGMGGLGCPASLYLAAAGVGEITLVDNDNVEISNLHRQVLYSEDDVNVPKAIAASRRLQSINSSITIKPLVMQATSKSMVDLMKNNTFDVVLDCTDNVPTRYLISDVCVLNKIPLVSGSALRMDGQLIIYNHLGAPCFRCLNPTPPSPNTVMSCGDAGVFGPAVGVIGVLQALETMKILMDKQDPCLSKQLLIFSGATTEFMNCRLTGKKDHCQVCGSNPTITEPVDYEIFCQAKADDKVHNINILDSKENISVKDFFANIWKDSSHQTLLLDVRPKLEFEMCHVPNSVNVPYPDINFDELTEILETKSPKEIYVICRRGNDSQRAIVEFKKKFADLVPTFNIRGGLHKYAEVIDPHFPVY